MESRHVQGLFDRRAPEHASAAASISTSKVTLDWKSYSAGLTPKPSGLPFVPAGCH